jgi:hypothetical protein
VEGAVQRMLRYLRRKEALEPGDDELEPVDALVVRPATSPRPIAKVAACGRPCSKAASSSTST